MATQNYTLRDQAEGNIPFNYSSSAEDIKREQRIADALNSWKLEGKVSPWQVLAKALTSYMSGKRMYDASESQKNLDLQSRDEYNKAWDMFTTPSEAEKSALEDPYIYKHTDPSSVGPTIDQLRGVQATPTAQPSVQPTPLGPQSPLAQVPARESTDGSGVPGYPQGGAMSSGNQKALARAIAAQTANGTPAFTGGATGSWDEPSALAPDFSGAGGDAALFNAIANNPDNRPIDRSANAPKGMYDVLAAGFTGGSGPTAQVRAAQESALAQAKAAQAAQQGQAQAAQQGQAQAAQQAQAQAQAQAARPSPTSPTLAAAAPVRPAAAMSPKEMAALRGVGMNVQDLGPDFVADRASAKTALTGAVQAEAQRKRMAMDALYNSGPRGQKESDALRAAQLAKMVKDKDDEFTTTSLGDGRFVTTNKRTGVTSYGNAGVEGELKPSEKVSVMKAHSDDTKELGKINTGINTLNKGLVDLDGVRQKLGDVGTGPWASVFNTVATKFPGEYGSKVKAVRAYFKSAAFQNARSTLSTNISDTDMKGFFATTPDDSWSDAQIFDYLDKFENAGRAQLNTDRETAGRYSSNIGEYNKMLGRSEGSSSPSQGGAPATINGVPRYQRGTTLRPGV